MYVTMLGAYDRDNGRKFAAVECLPSAPYDLHVLLRHRPRSISRASRRGLFGLGLSSCVQQRLSEFPCLVRTHLDQRGRFFLHPDHIQAGDGNPHRAMARYDGETTLHRRAATHPVVP